MKTSNNIIYPTFKDAQMLFSSYFTLQSYNILSETLKNTIDPTFINTLSFNNIREVYNNIILQYYPNETTIKSCFINQVLLKCRNHVTIFELPIGNSRADLCKINGTSVAYEIKTDLDNLQRLNKQINDYLQIFERVFVICSYKKLEDIKKQIAPSCGIYVYQMSSGGNLRFALYRNSSHSIRLDAQNQLSILRKQELKQYFNANNIQSREVMIENILNENTPDDINLKFKQIIKLRYHQQWNFLETNHSNILEIDYQWFFKNMINPKLIYN